MNISKKCLVLSTLLVFVFVLAVAACLPSVEVFALESDNTAELAITIKGSMTENHRVNFINVNDPNEVVEGGDGEEVELLCGNSYYIAPVESIETISFVDPEKDKLIVAANGSISHEGPKLNGCISVESSEDSYDPTKFANSLLLSFAPRGVFRDGYVVDIVDKSKLVVTFAFVEEVINANTPDGPAPEPPKFLWNETNNYYYLDWTLENLGRTYRFSVSKPGYTSVNITATVSQNMYTGAYTEVFKYGNQTITINRPLLLSRKETNIKVVEPSGDALEGISENNNVTLQAVYKNESGEDAFLPDAVITQPTTTATAALRLKPGVLYTLRVTGVPDGYVFPSSEMYIKVDETTGEVTEYYSYDANDNKIDGAKESSEGSTAYLLKLEKTNVSFKATVPGTKYEITYKDVETGDILNFADEQGNTEFNAQTSDSKAITGFVVGVEYNLTFTSAEEGYVNPGQFTFCVDAYGRLVATPTADVTVEAGNTIVFSLRNISDRDGDQKPELDHKDNNIYQGSDTSKGRVYIPDGNGDYYDVTGPNADGTYTDEDGNIYNPVDEDNDGRFDNATVERASTPTPTPTPTPTTAPTPDVNDNQENPETGDNTNVMLWIVLASVSACTIPAIMSLVSRKKTSAE